MEGASLTRGLTINSLSTPSCLHRLDGDSAAARGAETKSPQYLASRSHRQRSEGNQVTWVVARVCSEYNQYCERGVVNGTVSKGHRDNSVSFLSDLCMTGVVRFLTIKKKLGWNTDPVKSKYSCYTCRHTFAHRMLSGYWTGGVGCSIETLAELIGDTPKVAFDHYGKEWGQHYQDPLWAAIGAASRANGGPACSPPPATGERQADSKKARSKSGSTRPDAPRKAKSNSGR